MTKYELVSEIERVVGKPTERLWKASKTTLVVILAYVTDASIRLRHRRDGEKSVVICTTGQCAGCYRCRMKMAEEEKNKSLQAAFAIADREYVRGTWGPWIDDFEKDYGWLWSHPEAPWNKR